MIITCNPWILVPIALAILIAGLWAFGMLMKGE